MGRIPKSLNRELLTESKTHTQHWGRPTQGIFNLVSFVGQMFSVCFLK